MREKDFEAVALARIERAKKERDTATLGGYLVANYAFSVRLAACEALGGLYQEEAVKELLDALFRYDLGRDMEVQIIKTLSGMMTEEDLEQVRIEYDVSTDSHTLGLYTVLDRCVKY
ncbi:MAG: hypothetical protein IJZ37_07470 [Clostridia bacterium]|nr:hypothetical protein [Clostridia bacterium]MBQ8236502.1 hypothetical protein [Clostridia bacterium]MBQ8399016.1 hypothetical protein [Clostridia bacterium]